MYILTPEMRTHIRTSQTFHSILCLIIPVQEAGWVRSELSSAQTVLQKQLNKTEHTKESEKLIKLAGGKIFLQIVTFLVLNFPLRVL